MADEKVEMTNNTAGEMQATQQTESATTETAVVSAAEFAKLQAALKEANKEAAARRKRLEELEAADAKRKEAEMTETEKLTKRAQELETKLKAFERGELQRRVADKTGLPVALASRLIGETEADMEADAKALLETLPKPTKPQPGTSATNPNGAQISETREQKRSRLTGGAPDIWAGGGVVWPDHSKE